LDYLELQRPHGGKQRDALAGVAQVENLDDAFLEQLIHPFAELLVFARIGIVEIREALRREAGNLVEDDGRVLRESVSDAEARVADEANDVAGISFVDGLAFLAKSLWELEEAHFFARLGVGDDHVALEFAGADPDEGDTVAVPRVHIGLNLEDEAGRTRDPRAG